MELIAFSFLEILPSFVNIELINREKCLEEYQCKRERKKRRMSFVSFSDQGKEKENTEG